MFKKILGLVLALNTAAAFGAAKLQNEDFKSLSQITTAGGTAANLLNDTKVYSTQYSMQLSAAINAGLIGGSAAVGNLLTNGSFETGIAGWTYGSGVSAAVDTTNYIDGHQGVALTLTSVASGASVVSQSVTPSVQLGGQYLDEYIWVKTTVANINACGVLNGVQYSCVAVTSDGAWHQYQSHPSYATGTIGVQLVSTAVLASGTVNIDAGFAGISSGLVNVSALSDWVSGGVNLITATTTAPTKGTTTVDRVLWRRNGPDMEVRIEYIQASGGSNGSGDFLFAIPNSQSADLTKATPFTAIGTAVPVGNVLGIIAGSNPGPAAGTGIVSLYDATHVRLIGEFTNGTATFIPYSSGYQGLTGAITMAATYKVPIAGWTANVGAARSDQTNFGWTNGGVNLISATTTAPTKGTTAIDRVLYKRNGQNLDVRIEYLQTSAGTAGTGDYLFTLPGGYLADTTIVTPFTTVGSTQSPNNLGGVVVNSANTAVGGGIVTLYNQTQVRFQTADTSNSTFYNDIGSGHYQLTGTSLSYTANFSVPIAGWTETQKAPVLIGGITNASPTSERLIRALVTVQCTTSPCTIASQSGDFSSIVRNSTGSYTANFATAFSAPPTCVNGSLGTGAAQVSNGFSATTTQVSFAYFTSTTGNAIDAPFSLLCMGPR